MKKNKILIYLPLFTLAILFFIEIFYDYDILDRRLALALTDIEALGGYLIIYFILKKKYQIILPAITAWAVALGVWLDAMGNFLYYYANLSWWDDFTHFVCSMPVAIILFYVFYRLNKKGVIKLGRFNLNLFVVSVTMLLTAFYEISEFIGDLLFNTQRVGPRYDTTSDLTYNFLGTLLVVIIGNIIVRKQERKLTK